MARSPAPERYTLTVEFAPAWPIDLAPHASHLLVLRSDPVELIVE